MNCIKSRFEQKLRFEQKDYVNCYTKVEITLLLAGKSEPFDEHIFAICSFYGDDLDQHNQYTQLAILEIIFDGLNKESIDIPFVINRLRDLTQSQKNLFSEIIALVKLQLEILLMNTPSQLREELELTYALYNDTKLTESMADAKHIRGSIGRTESRRNSK